MTHPQATFGGGCPGDTLLGRFSCASGTPPVRIEGSDSTATEGIVTWVSKIPDIRVIRKFSQLPVTKGT